MYLHLAHDDKFIDYFINRQQIYFSNYICKYLVITNDTELRFVKSKLVELFPAIPHKINDLIIENNVTRVYIHYFTRELYEVVLRLPKNIKVFWIYWGSDGTSFPGLYHLILDDFSQRFYKNNFYEGKRNKLFNRGFFLKSTWLKYFSFVKMRRNGLAAFRRVDYFCHYLEEEYFDLKKRLKLKAKYLEFNYCSILDLNIENNDKFIVCKDAKNAIIGNSGCEANNHYSLMLLMAREKLNFGKIYCPLSYSGHPVYQDNIIKLGYELFGTRFVPLTSFLTKKEYSEILDKCNSSFHNHFRSQAFGNIAYQLFKGNIVYMNPKSVLYRYLSRLGLSIGTIGNDGFFAPNSVVENRKIINVLLSEENLNSRYYNVLHDS
jgi:dTDP-N-acetylfucosamine:lipid II N-acetylfucosaminyltransferase